MSRRVYKGISQIDPYWITPELGGDAASNPAAVDFYEPTWWRINAKRVHRTHLVIFRNGNLPDVVPCRARARDYFLSFDHQGQSKRGQYHLLGFAGN